MLLHWINHSPMRFRVWIFENFSVQTTTSKRRSCARCWGIIKLILLFAVVMQHSWAKHDRRSFVCSVRVQKSKWLVRSKPKPGISSIISLNSSRRLKERKMRSWKLVSCAKVSLSCKCNSCITNIFLKANPHCKFYFSCWGNVMHMYLYECGSFCDAQASRKDKRSFGKMCTQSGARGHSH